MTRGCFSSNTDATPDIPEIIECDWPVHIKGLSSDDIDDQDDDELSLYAAKHRCWRDLLLSSDEEGEWETARRLIEFKKEQKRMSRPSSRASMAASVTSVSSAYLDGNLTPRMRPGSATSSLRSTPVPFAVVSHVEA